MLKMDRFSAQNRDKLSRLVIGVHGSANPQAPNLNTVGGGLSGIQIAASSGTFLAW